MNISDSIRPRPVWARRKRRLTGRTLRPASDAEKHDAILILRDAPMFDWAPAGRELHEEALRVLDDG